MKSSRGLPLYLTLAIPVLVFAALFVVFVHSYWGPQLLELQRTLLVQREEDVMRNIVPSLQLDLLAYDLGSVHVMLRRLEETNADESMQVALFDGDGRRLYPLSEPPSPVGDGRIRIDQEIRADQRLLGTLTIDVDISDQLEALESRITTLENLVIGAAGVVLAMAVALYYWLVGLPLAMLAGAAQKLGRGDFSVDIPRRARKGMAVLADAFLSMRDALRDAQRDLKAQAREASEALIRYRTVHESMPGALLVVDQQGRVEDFNAAAEEIFGYSKKDVDGHACTILFDDQAHCAAEMAECFNQSSFSAVDSEKLGRRRDGSVVALRVYRKAMRADGGLKMVVIAMDISRIKEAERRLLAAKEEAERASQAKTEFLSRMSHELRTPLNAILGFGQLLAMDDELKTDMQRDNVAEIISAGEHLLHLINEVLDLSRIEVGRLEIAVERIDLKACMLRAIAQIRPLAEARGIVVELQSPSSEVAIRADRTRLTQILLNLLSNATKYNCEGGTIRLGVAAAALPGRLRVSIEDTGSGIAADDIDRLFQPFERIDADRNAVEGTGIGLALTKKLVEAMDGDIGVTSRVGEGSTFWFELPDGKGIEEVPATAS
ncbi:MAG: PAS domain S-box protein [Rhodocyclaceae bacterium]|nr:PAS domain S-box protein [Rhodocyclaceae bacterium]